MGDTGLAAGDDDQAPEARPALLSDLVALCRRLNEAGAAYVVIGGMAVSSRRER